MKIIHTFLPVRIQEINKKTIYQMTLSLLLAKKHYDKVVLYTDKDTAKIVRDIGLPYDEINEDLLDGVKTKTFSIPKLIVYAAQTEPYIHIDLDAFIFYKIEFNDLNTIYSTYNEGSVYMVNLTDGGIGFYNTYLKHTYELLDKLPAEFIPHIKFNEIPNMCIFGGCHYDLIAKASLYCLDIYENNRELFDRYFYNACIIEQLFIPSAIRMIIKNNDYHTNVDFHFIYGDENPSHVKFLPGKEYQYPFEVNSHNEKNIFENDLDLYSKISYNFNGFLHLCGSKDYDKFLYLIRSKIIFEFKGSVFINKINNLYPEVLDFEKNQDHYDEMKKITNKKRNLL